MAKGPGTPIEERISGEIREMIAWEIEDSGGNELFLLGRLDDDGLVRDVQILARGNAKAVPANALPARQGDVVIHNHPGGILVPSEADLSIASSLGSQGIGFYIVDNACSRVYVVVEPQRAADSADPLDPDEVASIFAPDGPLNAAHPNYEERPSQERMARDVTMVLDSSAVGVLEAGTGTGKSLAYLVPAALWALRQNRRVAIATRTINLQEQILNQDLPVLEAALGRPVKAVLVKGRGNYCCLRKRDLLEGDGGNILLDFDDLGEVQQLMSWSRATRDGSLSDLPFVPTDANWSLIRAESDSCTRARCFHFSSCFFYRARLEAASAQLLLANHHVLFADLSLRGDGHESAAIMPRYDAVILDEAHNVEDVALSYFDAGITRRGLMAHLGRLVSRRRAERGLVPFLRQRVKGHKGLKARDRDNLVELIAKLGERTGQVRRDLDHLFDDLGDAFLTWLEEGKNISDLRSQISERTAHRNSRGSSGKTFKGGGAEGREFRWRVPLERRNEVQWQGVNDLIEEMVMLIAGALTPLRRINSSLRELVDAGFDDLDHLWSDLAAVSSRLDGCVHFLKRVLEGEEAQEVFWVEVRSHSTGRQVSLHLTPLDVAPILQHTLFSQVGPVVMTSATLTVGQSFDFFDRQLGISHLEGRKLIHAVYPSPFDMGSQMRLAVLDGIPDPGKQGFTEGLSEAVRELVAASGGGALVLFTSYRTLDRVHGECAGFLENNGIRVLRQGEAQRSALLEAFRADPDSVLFATDSFWEGVDVVGSSLRLVILARLPFPVPTDPVTEARGQALIQQGRDPFYEDSIPRAIIRLRQGIGRLIRHRDDHGYAVICDGRIIRRSYGRVIISSLGDVQLTRKNLETLKRDVEGFLFQKDRKKE
ncbi:MAG: helicase C-terminal domain-containing protein [bacterium]|nr:helicase C-terminal domain-containing protein [bacterium]